jgi:hypothetical protein
MMCCTTWWNSVRHWNLCTRLSTKALVDNFEARLLALRKDKERRVGPSVKRGRQMMIGDDVLDGQQKKRPRGGPRKQKSGWACRACECGSHVLIFP